MRSIKHQIVISTAFAIAGLIVLAMLNMVSNQAAGTLSEAYMLQLGRINTLHKIDHVILETKFIVDEVSSNRRGDSCEWQKAQYLHNDALVQWRLFKMSYPITHRNETLQLQIAKIDKQFELIDNLLSLVRRNGDRKYFDISKMDELVVRQHEMLTLFPNFLGYIDAVTNADIDESQTSRDRYVYFGICIAGASLIVIVFLSLTQVRRISIGVGYIKEMLAHIARGDFRKGDFPVREDEFCQLASSLENASAHLREIVDSVKSAANKAANSSSHLLDQFEKFITHMEAVRDEAQSTACAMEEMSQNISESEESYRSVSAFVQHIEELTKNCQNHLKANRELMVSEHADSEGIMAEIELFVRHTEEKLSEINISTEKAGKTINDYIVPYAKGSAIAANEISMNMEKIIGMFDQAYASSRAVHQTAEDVSLVAADLRKLVDKCDSTPDYDSHN